MASVSSILSAIGHGFKKFFSGAVTVAQAAEPFIDIAFPGVANLYNATVEAIGKAENAAIAAGAQSGTGAQKLALVVASIEANYKAYAASQGITYDPAVLEAWADAVVKTLNTLPAAPQS